MPQISILGCGWLGFPLAKELLKKDYAVKGSTTSPEKIEVLQNVGIEPFQILLSENKITGNMFAFLQNSETLIIDIPPKLRSSNNESFLAKITLLIPFIEKSEIKNVLFISSTSVYGESDSETIDENTPLNPETESGRQLVLIEEMLKNNLNFRTTILRFGGLIGENRHPVYHLSGRDNVENPNAPINLIHLEDCIGIISTILQKNIWTDTFNAVAPFYPSRKEYYTKKATELGLDIPNFTVSGSDTGKIISSVKLQSRLHYTFKHIADF